MSPVTRVRAAKPGPFGGAVPVATNARMPALDNSTQGTVAAVEGVFKTQHRLACDVCAVRPAWQNVINGNADTAKPLLAFRAWLDIAGRYTSPIPFTFGGKVEIPADPGALLVPDWLDLRAVTTDTIYVYTYAKAASGEWFPISHGLNATGEGRTLGTGAVAAANAGTIPEVSGQRGWGPSLFLGRPATGRRPVAFGIAGDSIVEAPDGAGFLPWALNAAPSQSGVPLAVPVLTSLGGDDSPSLLGRGGKARWELLSACDVMLDEYGINGILGGTSAATVKARILEVGENALARGIRCARTTVTYSADLTSGQNTVRVAVNDWIRAGMPIDPATRAAVAIGTTGALVAGDDAHPHAIAAFEAADVMETARNSGVRNTANYVDNTHPNTTGKNATAAALYTELDRFGIDAPPL